MRLKCLKQYRGPGVTRSPPKRRAFDTSNPWPFPLSLIIVSLRGVNWSSRQYIGSHGRTLDSGGDCAVRTHGAPFLNVIEWCGCPRTDDAAPSHRDHTSLSASGGAQQSAICSLFAESEPNPVHFEVHKNNKSPVPAARPCPLPLLLFGTPLLSWTSYPSHDMFPFSLKLCQL